MRRKLILVTTAASIAFAGAVAVAGPAAAGPENASGKSVHFFCPGAEGNAHPGQHLGWQRNPDNQRRNVGGTCPAAP